LPERWPRPRRSSSHAATGSASRCYFFAALPACLVGIEACPTAHYWSRRLGTLGHTVRLLPPSYVKAYLKRSKNDANDAAAICEAVTVAMPPSIWFCTRFMASRPKPSAVIVLP
jgi:transposase